MISPLVLVGLLMVAAWLLFTLPGLEVGWGRRKLTVPWPTPLGGYGDRHSALSVGVHDDLWAKALVLRQGPRRLVLLSLDLVGVSKETRADVLDKLAGFGLASEELLMCATHTHSATGALSSEPLVELALGKFDAAALAHTVTQASLAVEDALAKSLPASLRAGSISAAGFSCNRRKAEGPTDSELMLLELVEAGGAPLAVVANFGCHPTILGADNLLVSRDFPGVFEDHLAELSGADLAIFTNGGEGDQRPGPATGAEPFERVTHFGRRLAEVAGAALAVLPERPAPRLAVAGLEVPVQAKGRALFLRQSVLVQVVRLGPLVILAAPGEISSGLALEFKRGARALGYELPFVIALANDHLGYLLAPEDYALGGYEARMCSFGPEAGRRLVEAGLTLARRLRAEEAL